MRIFWACLVLICANISPAYAANPQDCGDTPATAPAFELVDRNPSSPSYEEIVKSDVFLGRVWVIYWAQAS